MYICLFCQIDKINILLGFIGVVKYKMVFIVCFLDKVEWKDRLRYCVFNEQSYYCLGDEYGNLVDVCVDLVWI